MNSIMMESAYAREMDYINRALQTLAKAVGPAAWSWKSYPAFHSNAGQEFVWHKSLDTPLVTLRPDEQPESRVVALDDYARPFYIPGGYLGIWTPAAKGDASKDKAMIYAFDPDMLTPIDAESLPAQEPFERFGLRVNGSPLARIAIAGSLEAGSHRIATGTVLDAIDSLLVVVGYRRPSSPASVAIYDYQFSRGKVIVYPQDWFTAKNFDLRCQWITSVTRHPRSQRFIGHGIRLGTFELTEDGRNLSRWLRGSENGAR